jgi:ribonucleotide monophosphatase NagD (HAD superfamily)
VLVVGGEGLRAALVERGFSPVASADDEPQAVAQGFSPDLSWGLLAEGAYALERGLPWVASNTDLTIPTPRGRAPGNGTFVQVLRTATGREPLVAGKPETPMHAEAVARTDSRSPLVVGDRLDTDIEGANRADVPSLLVFTGVTDAADVVLATDELRPAFIADDLGGLHHAHPATRQDGDGWACGAAYAEVNDGSLTVQLDAAAGHRLDAVRASCAAAWTYGVRRLDPHAVRRELAAVLR